MILQDKTGSQWGNTIVKQGRRALRWDAGPEKLEQHEHTESRLRD